MATGTTVILKVRRGTYDALVAEKQKISVGEPCAVLSGDPSVPSGKAFYICFEAGDVRRMVSVEDLDIMASRGDFKGEKGEDGRGIEDMEVNAQGRLIITLTDGTRVDAGYVLDIIEQVDASEQLRIQAERDRASAEQGRASAEASRRTAETDRDTAEQARISNEAGRVSGEAVRVSNEAARVSGETAREQAAIAREKLWTEEMAPAVGEAIRATDAAAEKADAVVDDLIARRDAGEFRGEPFTYEDFTMDQLAALKGAPGSPGASIEGISRTSGNGAAGSTDIYTITLTDGRSYDLSVYNGADGQGAGDMLKSVYDAGGKNRDIFDYVDDSLKGKADLRDGKVPSSQLPSFDYVPTNEKGAAGGVAALGADGKVPSEQLPPLDYVPTKEKGKGGGVATLDADGKVPSDQLPSVDYIPADEKGAASGVATLDEAGKVPSGQLPSMDYILTADRGKAGGVATLDAAGRIPDSQLPDLDYEPSGSVKDHDTSTTSHADIREVLIKKGDALTFDPTSSKLYLKSGEEVVSETEVDTGAGDEVIQSWGNNTVQNSSSIAVGSNNTITSDANGSAVVGKRNTMSASYTFAVGQLNNAGVVGAVALGLQNILSSGAFYSMAAGSNNGPNNWFTNTLGIGLRQEGYGGTAVGRWNATREHVSNDSEAHGDALIVGNGTSTARSNALRASYSGDIYMLKAAQSSGADYAEFIKPWADNNPGEEDRVGYFVTIKDGLLRKADAGDYIAGITSGNPSVVGNADEDYYWRWERDVFGRIVLEDVPEYDHVLDDEGIPMFDEDGAPVMEATGGTVKRMKLSADYDKTLQETYVERKLRPEWDYVGMLGVLPVRDDGTCVPGQFCKCADGGIATLATERGSDTYMVIERITDSVVRVILR